MFEVRVHGRGGQGVVTAAETLSHAAFREGRHAQAFPTFGSERTGAPVIAFCRIDDVPIRLHEPIAAPDAVIVQDPTLLHQVRVFEGLAEGGFVLVNTAKDLSDLGLDELVARLPAGHARAVAASELARERLGRPIPNAPLLGAFAALTGEVSLDAVCAALGERFGGGVGLANQDAARAGHAALSDEDERSHA